MHMAGSGRSFDQRLSGHYAKPKKQASFKENTFSDYLAMGVVPPYVLLCGLMVIAGMMALSGLLELAIAAGFISLVVNYVRFRAYAPSLFGKFPWTLFNEIDEKGERTDWPMSDNKRRTLMIVFVFGFSIVSAIGLTFFSLMLMKTAFINLGILGIASFGGFSLVPALVFFGAASFLCAWPMFADGASNLFARKDFWDRMKNGMKKFFVLIPDESLLLPEETLDDVGEHTLMARQIARLILVIALLGLAAFGNFMVSHSGFGYMLSIIGFGGANAAQMVLSSVALVGGSVFITAVLTQLMTLAVLASQLTWQQYMLPVDYKVKDQPWLRYSLALFAAPVLMPLLVIRGLMAFAQMEFRHLKDTLVSRKDMPVDDKPLFLDADTVFENIRCNTKNIYVNLVINSLIIMPITAVISVGIFLSQHIKLFALINSINSGVTSFNGQSSPLSNALCITGYGSGSLGFGMDGQTIDYLNGPRRPLIIDQDDEPPLKMVLFSFILKPKADEEQESPYTPRREINSL